jgi:hypothetical protein
VAATNSQFVVEECLAYRVGDAPPIAGMHEFPTYAGSCSRRYFRCAHCGRLVETLFLPPDGQAPRDADFDVPATPFACRGVIGWCMPVSPTVGTTRCGGGVLPGSSFIAKSEFPI